MCTPANGAEIVAPVRSQAMAERRKPAALESAAR